MSRSIFTDTSLSAVSAGFVAVLVGVASSIAIVFEAARAAGASEAMMVSWIGALGLGMGLTCILFSWYYRAPVITAWSTPGAALLATSLQGVSMPEAVGAFLFSAVLTLLLGLSGTFDKVTQKIPAPVASAMLAGILVQFGLSVFTSLQTSPALVGAMLAAYLLGRRWLPRYAIILVLITGFIASWLLGLTHFEQIHWALSQPILVAPEFKLSTLFGVGLPLFIVTMTSQNIPGVATLRASGYERVPVSPVISGTGLASLLLTPFGGFAFNLAAITAAICTGPEAHPDPAKRYTAGIAAGVFYLLVGLGGVTVVSLFSAFPPALIASLAGLALIGTIGASLEGATRESDSREAALITFLVTASGASFLGVGSAFWGLVGGLASHWIFKRRD
ncbi:benzoate/H(+) symporter BenE family transporter [Microbulbifer thermotolerans]|uniref:benzoate/H(+) symporter BenE family transporter n=1 Tax=Microbulbifer thermotolerans TaxID=252514 RepID=UPI00224B93DE|nr:benzoate/H(+) symporter BenE family transporter [Microbulbifer thermotolerans]MCX2842778.1 benzoate/H(+) symporter BenE family transporter [Microbulbifer thermotolerans]